MPGAAQARRGHAAARDPAAPVLRAARVAAAQRAEARQPAAPERRAEQVAASRKNNHSAGRTPHDGASFRVLEQQIFFAPIPIRQFCKIPTDELLAGSDSRVCLMLD